MSIRKILVAVDGSNHSFNASAYAIDWAKRNDAELIAIHVIYPTYSPFQTALSPRPERIREITKKEKEKGQRCVDKVEEQATDKKVNVKTDVIVGVASVVKEIVKYAENNKVDIIVIGSRGMTGIKKMLLGSIATGVVTYSHCPVLVVK